MLSPIKTREQWESRISGEKEEAPHLSSLSTSTRWLVSSRNLGQATICSWALWEVLCGPKWEVLCGAGKSQETPFFSQSHMGSLSLWEMMGFPLWGRDGLCAEASMVLNFTSQFQRDPGPEVKQLGAEEGRAWLTWHREARAYVTRKSREYQAGPHQEACVDTWKNVDMTTLPLWFVTFHFNFSLFLIVKLSNVPLSYFCLGAYKERCQFS